MNERPISLSKRPFAPSWIEKGMFRAPIRRFERPLGQFEGFIGKAGEEMGSSKAGLRPAARTIRIKNEHRTNTST